MTQEINCHFESQGFLDPVILQCDKKMSIKDVCRKVARERKSCKCATSRIKKRVTRTKVLLKQYTDTYKDLHNATKHKSK